jgi:hypothetical protein
MNSIQRPYIIFFGTSTGLALAFTFYKITGLNNPAFFTDATFLRVAADAVCLLAFICLGCVLAEFLFRFIASNKNKS